MSAGKPTATFERFLEAFNNSNRGVAFTWQGNACQVLMATVSDYRLFTMEPGGRYSFHKAEDDEALEGLLRRMALNDAQWTCI